MPFEIVRSAILRLNHERTTLDTADLGPRRASVAKAEDPSQPLKNARHEAFAVHYAANRNAAQAWLKAGGKNKTTANRQGDKWAKRGDIKTRVGWLRNEAERRLQAEAEAQTESAVLTIEEKRRFLARVVRGKPEDASADNPDCEVRMSKAGPYYAFPDKLRAVAQDNDLAGDGSQARANDSFSEQLARIRNLPR